MQKMYEVDHRYLKFVDSFEMNSWDVKYFFKNNNTFNKNHKLVFFGEFLKKATIEKVNISDKEKYKILGVRSYGKGAFINREVYGSSLKMRQYFKAKKDHLFWCKVDTKNGAFGIIDDELAEGYASSNMIFSQIDLNKIIPEFLQLLFRDKKVIQYLDSFVTGTTNRKYIRPDQLLNEIQIPLPSIAEQKAILDDYQQKIENAKQLETEAKTLEQSIEKYLFEELGIVENRSVSKKGLMLFDSKSISEWGTDKILSKSNTFSTLFEIKNLESSKLTIEIFRGKSPKYSVNSKSLILNQKCNRWNEIDLSFAKNVDDFWFEKIDEKFFTKENDILINSTGEGTIGRSSLINSNYVNLLYDSHLLLLRLNQNYVNPVFFVNLFNSSFVQSQIDSIKSAQATKQTELGINNLKKISFPLPPLEKQKEIAKHISAIKDNIKSLKQNAETLKAEAEKEFEEKIFN